MMSSFLILAICSSLISNTIGTVVQGLNTDQINGIFIGALVDKYGTDGQLSREQFTRLVESLAEHHIPDELSQLNISKVVEGDHEHVCSSTELEDCAEYLTAHCLDSENIFDIYSSEDHLNADNLTNAFPSLVFSLQNKDCNSWNNGVTHHLSKRPTDAEIWGCGIGFVAFINLISNIGACLGPFMKTRLFHLMLMFCVAVAVGALTGTGFLILIPESLGLTEDETLAPGYIWKISTVIAGLYFFYLAEQIMTTLTTQSDKKEGNKSGDVELPLRDKEKELHDVMLGDHGHSHGKVGEEINPVAWMLLCGDSLHKFVDGLSIGAAFSESIGTGLGVSLAIVCEEFPHELGDIAILLHAGLSMKRALIYNLLAAVVGFAGLVVGILVGENPRANQAIFAVAAGLFIYVSLVDLIPEMTVQAKNFKKINKKMGLKVHLIQNAGLIIGFSFTLLLANFSSEINF